MRRRDYVVLSGTSIATLSGCLRLETESSNGAPGDETANDGTTNDETTNDGTTNDETAIDGNVERELSVEVLGEQFQWSFDSNNGLGAVESQLVVPANTAVRLEVTSNDVWHTLGIADLGIRADAIPGETHATGFIVDEIQHGTEFEAGDERFQADRYTAECLELCGAEHNEMTADVYAISQNDYREYVTQQGGELPSEFTNS